MAYVSEFHHDVFISYAVVDNDGPYGEKRGWVQAFEERLKALLQREVVHKRAVDVWLDRKRLTCGDAFDDEIRDALQATAVLVVLLSKQYLASAYCQMERETFLQVIARQRDPEKRIFIVELTDPQEFPGTVPDEITRIHHVRMWELQGSVPTRLGDPIPNHAKVEHQSFYDRTREVAYAISKRLNEMAKAAPPPDAPASHQEDQSLRDSPSVSKRPEPVRAKATSGPTIYLSQPPKGTNEEGFARKLKTSLENAIPPVRVLPDQTIPRTPDDATEFVQEQLGESRLYVHLVGYNRGATPAGFSLPISVLQKQLADGAEVPSLIWRLPDVEPADIDDANQRQLADQARAGEVEDCHRAIVDRIEQLAREEATAASSEADDGGAETLFVNHLPDDEDLARDVCRVLARNQYVCVKRSFDGATEQELRQSFERSLRSCDSLLMIYGKATKPAAQTQVLECLKVAGYRPTAGKSIRDWFVVVGPPPKPNASLDLFFDGLHDVDCIDVLETPLIAALAQRRNGGGP